MSRKTEWRMVERGGCIIRTRLMGFINGYAMVRRSGAMPFVITAKEWDAAPFATPTDQAKDAKGGVA